MLVKEKYCRCKLSKKILLITFIILSFSVQSSFSSPNQKLIDNLIKTDSLSFLFKQKIGDKVETGRCLLKYPKLMHCYYDNKEKKELISDGYTLAVLKKKYNKIYLYPLITLTLNHLLNKEFILKELSLENHKRLKIADEVIEFEVYNKKQKIIVLFS